MCDTEFRKKYSKKWRVRFTYRSRKCRVTGWTVKYQETKGADRNKYSGSEVPVAAEHTSKRRYQQESMTQSPEDYIKHAKLETIGIETETIQTHIAFECKCAS